MKKTHSVETASEPAPPIQTIAPCQEDQEQLPAESLNLTPQRILQGASTTTEVLVGILALASTAGAQTCPAACGQQKRACLQTARTVKLACKLDCRTNSPRTGSRPMRVAR